MSLNNHSLVNKNIQNLDILFKVLTLIFWPIIWYKWIFISTYKIDVFLFYAYSFIALIYILFSTYLYSKKYKINKMLFVYRLFCIICFILTLLSFLVFPTIISFLYIKIAFIFVFMYISYKTYRNNLEEGVVGMISSLLLLVITFSY